MSPADEQQILPTTAESAQGGPPQYTEHYAPAAQTATPPVQAQAQAPPALANPFADTTTSQKEAQTHSGSFTDVEDEPEPYHEHDIPDTASLAYPQSLLPAYNRGKSYKGRYKTEEEYLDALRAWVKEKEYMQPVDRHGNSITLHGYYGSKTSDDYIREASERKSWKGRESERPWGRKKSVVASPVAGTPATIDEDAVPAMERTVSGRGENGDALDGAGSPVPPKTRRRSSLADWLKGRRKSSVAVEQA